MVKLMLSLALVAGACAGGVRTCAAQGITNTEEPKIIWSDPPPVAVWSPDSESIASEIVTASGAKYPLASANWEAVADTVYAELRACTKLHKQTLAGWTLWTVNDAHFKVKFYSSDTNKWETDTFDGWAFNHSKRILVVQWRLHDRGLIKHEMLHAMLYAHGFDARHNRPVTDALFAKCVPEKPR